MLATLLSVTVGGILAIGGGIITQLWQWRQERRAIAHAFAGEVSAIVAAVEKRGYLKKIEQTIQKVNQTLNPQTYNIAMTRPYFRIYETNAGKIGLLPASLTKRLAWFYTLVFSLIEDVSPENNRSIGSVQESLEHLNTLVELGSQLLSDGKRLVEALDNV